MENLIIQSITGLIFASYVSILYIEYGATKSISLSFYELEKKNHWIFRALFLTLGLCIAFTKSGWFWYTVAVSGALIGVFSRCRFGWKRDLHITFAVCFILGSFVAIGIDAYGSYPDISLYGFLIAATILFSWLIMITKEFENKLWSLEICWFISIMVGIMAF